MKLLPLLIASLAIPAGIVSAQTPAPSTPPSGQAPYIALFPSTSPSTGGAANSTWYIDTTRNLVVLCSQSTGGGQTFTCTAQAVPTSATTAGTAGMPSGGAAATPSATPSSGASATPAGGTSGG